MFDPDKVKVYLAHHKPSCPPNCRNPECSRLMAPGTDPGVYPGPDEPSGKMKLEFRRKPGDVITLIKYKDK